jgi:hypothetical protein
MGALPQERKGELRGNIYIPTGDPNQPLHGGLFSV